MISSRVRTQLWHIALVLLVIILTTTRLKSDATQDHESEIFVEKPYIQLGYSSSLSESNGETLVITWTTDRDLIWGARVKTTGSIVWQPADSVNARRVAVSQTAPFRIYTATFKNLKAGVQLTYRILLNNKVVFEAITQTKKPPVVPYRFAVFGDTGVNSSAQKRIAYQAYKLKPDFVMIPGDITYPNGRISEYRRNFFPIYNADGNSPKLGVPFMRSTLFVAAPGNHDIGYGSDLCSNLDKFPDGLAYFLFWQQPLNGPIKQIGAASSTRLTGTDSNKRAFLAGSSPAYPTMANFSFNYGNSHWLILDSNEYTNWTDAKLRSWVKSDLASAQKYTWRFVCFHHPGFCSDKMFAIDTRMRLLCDLFEEAGVDIVFSGHAHNYERTFPLRLKHGVPIKALLFPKVPLSQIISLDQLFDGKTYTKPQGITYIITGGGGAALYSVGQHRQPWSWQSFTAKFVSNVHSFTDCTVNDKALVLRQVSEDGMEIERLTFSK